MHESRTRVRITRELSRLSSFLSPSRGSKGSRESDHDVIERERRHFRSFIESLKDWVWEMNTEGVHTYSNAAVEDLLGYRVDEVVGFHVTKLWRKEEMTPESLAWLERSLAAGKGWRNFEGLFRHRGGGTVITESTAIPIYSTQGRLMGYRGIDRNITQRRREQQERERLIGELRDALKKVRTLSGLLPICAHCKRIRDDKGYWSQVEVYIRDHSGAEFSHGICPECMEKLYPDFVRRTFNKEQKKGEGDRSAIDT